MSEIKEEILQQYGIYQKRKLKENEKMQLLKIKQEIEKIIKIPIEKLYLAEEAAWGKEPEKSAYSICVLVDKRTKDLREKIDLLIPYAKNKKIDIALRAMCQFEKRKMIPTEKDYYIHQYGIKVYDSGKEPEINESLGATQYGRYMEYHREFRNFLHTNVDYWMNETVRIYTLKMGYALISRNAELERDCNFAKLITKDKKIISMIDSYLEQTEQKAKEKILDEFEEYVTSLKQVKFSAKLEEKPTMKVYEKLLKRKQKQGTLDIKTLTKDDLYTMYIIQDIDTSLIAELYGVENKKIAEKRNSWQIKRREAAFTNTDEIIKKTIESAEMQSSIYAYALLKKSGIMGFEKCTLPILKYMLDNEVYLLKEFWQFTKNEKNKEEKLIFGDTKYSYCQASMAVELLLQNNLIKEVDFKQYQITKEGKELVWYCIQNDIEEITIPIINKKFKNVQYYELYYTEEYPTDIEEVTWEKLYHKWNEYCHENFPELLREENLPIENEVKNEEEIALVWMYLFFSNLEWRNLFPKQWEKTIFIGINDILNPIRQQIKEKSISVVMKEDFQLTQFLDISNVTKYIEIEKVEDMVEYAAVSCAYLIKIRER